MINFFFIFFSDLFYFSYYHNKVEFTPVRLYKAFFALWKIKSVKQGPLTGLKCNWRENN